MHAWTVELGIKSDETRYFLDSCQVSVSCKDTTIEDLFKANKSVKKLKSCLLAIPQPGFLERSNGKYAPIHWQSKKIKRVVKSTIAAETLELLEAAEHCFFIRTVLCEIYKLNAKEDVLSVHLLTIIIHYMRQLIQPKHYLTND